MTPAVHAMESQIMVCNSMARRHALILASLHSPIRAVGTATMILRFPHLRFALITRDAS